MIPIFNLKAIEIQQTPRDRLLDVDDLENVIFSEQISPVEFKIRGLKVPKTITSFNVAISDGHWYIIQCDTSVLLIDSSSDHYDLMIDGTTDKQYAMVPYPFPKDGVHIKRDGDKIIVNGKPYPLQSDIDVSKRKVGLSSIRNLSYYKPRNIHDGRKFIRISSVEIKHLTKGKRSRDRFVELADIHWGLGPSGKLKDSIFINKNYEMFFTKRFIQGSSIYFWSDPEEDYCCTVKITQPGSEYLILPLRRAETEDMLVRTNINYQSK
jgi:hypothetical protein